MALDLNDKTANGNNLTNSGAAEVITDLPFPQSAIAADLEADDSDYLYAADSASLSITGNLTIELWVKFESLPSSGNTMELIPKYDDQSGNQRSWRFFLFNDGGTLKLQFNYSDDGTAQDALAVNWTPSTGTWYHVAVTLTAASSQARFYVDGVQQGTTQTGTKTAIFNSTARVGLGALNVDGTPSSFLDGIIDDVRIWNTVRTITQIANGRSSEMVGNESGLQAYWPFESVLGSDGLQAIWF